MVVADVIVDHINH